MELDQEEQIWKQIVTKEYPTDPRELLGERDFNDPREIPPNEIGSPVQEFFRGTTIFITGATGFVGIVLLEKLLRSCPHISRIYLLIRSKRGQSSEERFVGIFKDRVSTYTLCWMCELFLYSILKNFPTYIRETVVFYIRETVVFF